METSTKLSLGQAAREPGKSKATLSKAIKTGRLSATKSETGGYAIEPVELFRVYPPVTQVNSAPTPKSEQQETLGELLELRVRLEAERQLNKGFFAGTLLCRCRHERGPAKKAKFLRATHP